MTLDDIEAIIIDLDIDEIGNAVKAELERGETPQNILKALTEGLDEVGRLYEEKEYYLTELVLAGETMKEAFSVLGPYLKAEGGEQQETIIVATVKGDNHDLGKNILISMLISAGFNIIDLGIDTPAEKIVEAVKETGARLVALSSLLTMTVEEISVVDKALKEAGLRDKIKLVVGGAPLNMELAKKMGADNYADDAVEGARLIKSFLQ